MLRAIAGTLDACDAQREANATRCLARLGRVRQTEGRTDGLTDGRTDGRARRACEKRDGTMARFEAWG